MAGKTMTFIDTFDAGTPESDVRDVRDLWRANALCISSNYVGSEVDGWTLTTVLKVVQSVMNAINRLKTL